MLGKQVANYRIDERLGEGGMGVVYKAIDLNLDRPVALKFLSAELSRDPGLIQRFQSEARAQANLNHTNIATLYNFINVDGNWLIAMEYIDGETLEQMIRRAGAMQPQDAIPLFKQALLGVGFAHRMGIVHRDIKPANIMVNRYGIVKVMDFGIAKVLSARNMTRTGVSVGTVAYMSPEQIRNSGVDGRSDIYSLGVTLYEMLTAQLPFNSNSDYQIQYDHVNTPPPPLSVHYPHIPGGIEAAVLKALEKNPADRFAAVEQFGVALENPDVVPEKYQEKTQAPVVAVNPLQKTVVEAAGQGQPALALYARRLQDPKFWASRNVILAAVAVVAVLAVSFGIAFWPKSKTNNTPGESVYSDAGSGGASSSAAQNPQEQQPQEPGASQPGTLELRSDKSQNSSGNQGTTGAQDQSGLAESGKAAPKKAHKSASQTVAASAQSAGFNFFARRRHVAGFGGIGSYFGHKGNNPGVTYFSSGQMTVSPAGAIAYRCIASPNPNGCEPPVSLTKDDIKSVNLNPDGSLHITTFGRGNYDFYGARSALVQARDTVLSAKRQ
jgi:serine/threonine protein kinase